MPLLILLHVLTSMSHHFKNLNSLFVLDTKIKKNEKSHLF